MSPIAAVRPDDWNLPLLVHVLGALLLVAGLAMCASGLAAGRGDARLLRLGYWSLVVVAVPGWAAMRVGAEWIARTEGWDEVPESVEPTWLTIGGIVADVGAPVLLLAVVLGGVGLRRLRTGAGSGLLRATLALSVVLLLADLVAAWAMSGKPA